jgi:hypothetical protein
MFLVVVSRLEAMKYRFFPCVAVAYLYTTWGNMVVRKSKFFRLGISSDTTVTCLIKRTDANLQMSGCTLKKVRLFTDTFNWVKYG